MRRKMRIRRSDEDQKTKVGEKDFFILKGKNKVLKSS